MIVGLLPNLDGAGKSNALGFSTASGSLALLGTSSERLRTHLKANAVARTVLGAFRRDDGRRYFPAFLLLSPVHGIPAEDVGQAIYRFRNILVASFCLRARCLSLGELNSRPEFWSDLFALHPADVSGEALHIRSRARLSLFHPVNRILFTHDSRLSVSDYGSTLPDTELAGGLLDAWSAVYERAELPSAPLQRVLRSLDLASQAMSFESMGWSHHHSFALKAVTWYSAMETLLNARDRDVGFRDIVDALEGIPWWSPHMRRKSFCVRRPRRAGRSRASAPVICLEALYDLRNDFVHGNDLGQEVGWMRFRRAALSPVHAAPAIYRALLIRVLDELGFSGKRDVAAESSFCEYLFPETKGTLLMDPLKAPNRITVSRRP